MPSATWTSGASTDMNATANYSAVWDNTYDLVFDGTSVINAAATAAISCKSITITSAYTGTWSFSGQTVTCSEGFSDDGITGAHTYGTALTCNGASATVHFNSGAATTATSCAIILNGTTGMVFDDDKGIIFKSLALGASAIVTISGGASSTFSSATTPLVFTNAGTLTTNTVTNFELMASGALITITAGAPTFNGNSILYFKYDNGVSATLPSITITGTARLYLTNQSINDIGSITLTGALTCNQLRIYCSSGGSDFTFNTGNYSISCTDLYIGSNNATASSTYNFGSSNVSINQLIGGTYNTGTSNIAFQTSTWSFSGAWTFGSTHTITGTAATTSVTITNTSTVTSNGKTFPGSFIVNAATKTITMADALIAAGAFTLTAGTLTTATFNLTVTGNVSINGTSVLTASGSTCSFGGDYTTAAGATVTINAATNYTFTKNGAAITTNGITLPQITMNSNFSISGTCTITRLIRGVDGFTGTFGAGQTFTISNLLAANWNGAAGSLNRVSSSTPGTRFVLVLPNAATLTFYDSQDCEYRGFDVTANDGTSITRGNNLRYLTYNIVSVLPITGPEAGGTTLTFTDTGNGFGGTCTVTVGGNAAGAVTVLNTHSLTAVTPAGAVGATNIVITNGDGQVYNLLAIFSYTEPVGGVVTGEARCWIGTGIGI